jgi:hypothetical protein
MRPEDKKRLFAVIDLTYDVIGVGEGKFISGPAKAVFFDDLVQYPIEIIEQALQAHRQDPQRGKFTPKPADIIFQIERRMPVLWIGADEAWARIPKPHAPRSFKDHEGRRAIDYRSGEWPPCILNQVTAAALAAAAPLVEAGDHVAARMAFRSCYDRLVEQEKLERRAPQHFLSPGGSHEERLEVVAEGVRQGLLPKSAAPASELLAAPTPQGAAQLRQIRMLIAARPMPKPEGEDYE